jgi:hypothetical protein
VNEKAFIFDEIAQITSVLPANKNTPMLQASEFFCESQAAHDMPGAHLNGRINSENNVH